MKTTFLVIGWVLLGFALPLSALTVAENLPGDRWSGFVGAALIILFYRLVPGDDLGW